MNLSKSKGSLILKISWLVGITVVAMRFIVQPPASAEGSTDSPELAQKTLNRVADPTSLIRTQPMIFLADETADAGIDLTTPMVCRRSAQSVPPGLPDTFPMLLSSCSDRPWMAI